MTVLGFTRPASKLEASIREAEAMGFTVLAAPSLEVEMAPESEFERLESSLTQGSTAVFGSTTAADMCSRHYGERFPEIFSRHRVYAIGSKTADALRSAGIIVTDVPDEFSSYGLLQMLQNENEGSRIVMVRSDSGTDILSKGIEESGAELVDIAVYRLTDAGVTPDTERMMDAISEGRMDWIAFTSPMSAKTFFEHMGARFPPKEAYSMMCYNVKVAAIGRPTAEMLERLGRKADLIPAKSTFGDLLESIRKAC